MSGMAHRALKRALGTALEAHAVRLRESGRLDRRDFVRLLGGSAMTGILSACSAQGSEEMSRLLRAVGRQNERVERWMQRRLRAEDRAPRGLPTAGDALPSYHISPAVPTWDAAAWGEWSLVVDGAVRTPLRLSLGELRRLATRTQRVEHFCVEGWTAAVEWNGVPMTTLVRMAGPLPGAGYVDFNSFDDGYHESWDLESVTHPQTLVALGKDGAPLSAAYGAPARVHSPVKLGYKNTKYLTRITLLAAPNGGYWSDQGYEWFGGT